MFVSISLVQWSDVGSDEQLPSVVEHVGIAISSAEVSDGTGMIDALLVAELVERTPFIAALITRTSTLCYYLENFLLYDLMLAM